MSKNKDGSERKDRKDTRASGFFTNHEKESNEIGIKFGKHLQDARYDNGYTQISFAKEIGMSENTYKKYEGGSYQQDRPYFIYYLAQKLNVSADYLVGLSDNKHPEYDEVIQKTGLSSDSIDMLQKIRQEDGGDEYIGYMDFINCFLGNKASTELFFHALLPLIHTLSNACDGESYSTRMQHTMASQITDLIYEYLYKVVIPSFSEQYNKGSFTPVDPKKYLTDKAAVKASKKKKRKKKEG